MIAPARIAAYEILRAVSSGRADLPTAIASARDSLRDDRDRALAAEIATGVQRWRAALDHLIAVLSKRAVDRLDSEVVDILRLSGYQLLHLTRVPASAVVDDAVKLTRRAGKQSAAGFVNAVLRTLSRRKSPRTMTAVAETPHLITWPSRCLTRDGWWSDGSIGMDSTPPRPGCGSTTRRHH